ncbi:MAG: Stp1/IreP family PP2C-type Ser/Thr phosphatase [Bdellovibrionales bacterium]|nr:Stp1/IreP family PP2C-type Ser/Thr phosphatase [Bdellovibrionales bacterium]
MTTSTSQEDINPLTTLRYAAGTDIGRRREENQDSFGVIENEHFRLYLVADGMGGVKGGAIASSLAINVVRDNLKSLDRLSSDALISAIQNANAEIFEKGEADTGLAGMGTTLVGAAFIGSKLMIANVGDSRLYRVRNGRIKQLSEDHTLVRELILSGTITPDQAENHPVAHMLTRSLGPTPTIDVDCWLCDDGPARGDLYILCSDGLYNLVGSRDLIEIVQNNSLDDAIKNSIDLANARGGTDNITVIIIEVGDHFPVDPSEYPEDDKQTSVGLDDTAELYIDRSQLKDQVAADREIEESQDENGEARESPIISGAINIEKLAGTDEEPVTRDDSSDEASSTSTLETGTTTVSFKLSRAQIEVISIGFAAMLIGFVVGGWFYTGEDKRIDLAKDPIPVVADNSGSRDVLPPKPLLAEVARVELGMPAFAPPSEMAMSTAPLSRVAGSATLSDLLSDTTTEIYNGLTRLEVENLSSRKRELRAFLESVDDNLKAFDLPISGDLVQKLRDARRASEKLKAELEEVQVQMDNSARKLAVWYGRQKRLQNTEPINLASEVSVSSPQVKDKKEIFERATWAYLEAAEVLRYNPSDEGQKQKVNDLLRVRKQRMNELAREVQDAIGQEVREADHRIAELTLERDRIEGKLAALQKEIEYAQTLMGNDPQSKNQMRQKLIKEQKISKSELEELEQLLPKSKEIS